MDGPCTSVAVSYCGRCRSTSGSRSIEQKIVTVGLDLAKNVFQVHAIAADGAVLIRRKLRRTEVIRFFTELSPCLVDMEACVSPYHWARELMVV